jgi:hypothetical protein
MSDFKGEDFDFAVGSIKGLRSWSIDDKGRLRGVTHPAIWTPGENVSACRAPSGPIGLHCGDPACALCRHLPTSQPKPPAAHTFDPECQCGFWAYDEVGFEEHGDAVGIIEGYGRTTIGTKGFRCEKAKIVALCRDTEKGTLSLSEWLRLKELYPAAEFHDEFDDMVMAHGQVLRSWPTVGEGFWDEEVPASVSDAIVRFSANTAQYQTAMMQALMVPRAWRQGSWSPGPPTVGGQP